MMTGSKDRLKVLLEKYRLNRYDEEEWAELQLLLKEAWLQSSGLPDNGTIGWEAMYARITAGEEENKGKVVRIGKWKPLLWKGVAAAVVFGLLVTIALLWIQPQKNNQLSGNGVHERSTAGVPPGTDKAVLTLADGRQIALDRNPGNIAAGGGLVVVNMDGELSYRDIQGQDGGSVFHTVSTPRGGQYQLVLSDGSKVWLNAASSLKFPAGFTGRERVVELTGEGYFEIAHRSNQPFHVQVNGLDVEVLGTKFNINSYNDESAIRTTLLEGSVKVALDNSSALPVLLKPGEQAVLTGSADLRIERRVNTDEVVSWKNGLFYFEKASIQAVMRQVARWYDVEVQFKGAVSKELFGGKIQRNLNLAQVLEILETTGINYRLEGRKLIITN